MTRAPRIAIVGGGVGGLAAALALERLGAEIVVCEQSPALNEIGAGLNLSPNALMALRALGVEDAVIALGSGADFFASDAWTEEVWTRECDVSELTTTYAGWHPNLLRLYACSARWYKWALYDRNPVERWSKGRVTLLGDSAHAMLPYLGQGAAMAIEDACVLSAAIARYAEDLDKALLA